MVTTGRDIGTKLCEAMGVDPGVIKSISFQWGVLGTALITFGYMPTGEQTDKIATVFKNYELQEIPEADASDP